MLSLVPVAAAIPPLESPRKVFWRAYLAWLSKSSHEELVQFEQALAPHAHEVRPLVDAVRDALLTDPSSLPAALLAQLQACGWSASVLQLAHKAA